MISGIIPINKPAGFTSFDVIAKLRGIMKIKRLGHAGTLDPMATGVLPVFVGRATKACGIMPDETKSYVADFKLGQATDTLDITGRVTATSQSRAQKEDIIRLLPEFRGEISQLPPMFSAVSVNGRRLYELAREGKTIDRQPREVTVHALKLLSFDSKAQTGTLEISCSKGTYVRSLVGDLGERIGCHAVLTGLVRTRAGAFGLPDCVTLEQMQGIADAGGDFSKLIIPVERAFSDYCEIRLNQAQTRMFVNGVKLDLNRVKHAKTAEPQRVYGDGGDFLGLARADEASCELKIERMFCERE